MLAAYVRVEASVGEVMEIVGRGSFGPVLEVVKRHTAPGPVTWAIVFEPICQ